jgi:hypothetical protein
MRAVIFAGPSLPPHVRPSISVVEWLPPVRQGDVYRAALTRPAIIAIVDGYFEVTPTVWHKEILWAMAQGIQVYGAASIGALRAAELDAFGMKGVGRIYEMYRDGVLQDDDEVAVLHGPEELGFPSLTEAMVNVRATLGGAVAVHVTDAAIAERLIRVAKALFYKDRTYDRLFEAAALDGFDAAVLRPLRAFLSEGQIDQKRRDALEMLEAVQNGLAVPRNAAHVRFRFAWTAAWDAAVQRIQDEAAGR